MFGFPFQRVSKVLANPTCPIGRTELYEWAQRNPGLIKKSGAMSLLDMELFRKICEGLPNAKLRPPGEIKSTQRSRD
jgi:hypothetical protein